MRVLSEKEARDLDYEIINNLYARGDVIVIMNKNTVLLNVHRKPIK